MTDIIGAVASRLNLSYSTVANTVALLDEGATVPFIARYRKERTGSLDEVAVRDIETTFARVRELEKRKEFVSEAIAAAGALTDDLRRRLAEAASLTDVEDIYAPSSPSAAPAPKWLAAVGWSPWQRLLWPVAPPTSAGVPRVSAARTTLPIPPPLSREPQIL